MPILRWQIDLRRFQFLAPEKTPEYSGVLGFEQWQTTHRPKDRNLSNFKKLMFLTKYVMNSQLHNSEKGFVETSFLEIWGCLHPVVFEKVTTAASYFQRWPPQSIIIIR
jgi:hypothetical protein